MLHWKLRKTLNVLNRRRNYLEGREAIRTSQGLPASFDAAEVAALRWAADTLRRMSETGALDQKAIRSIPDVDWVEVESRLVSKNQTAASGPAYRPSV